MLKTKGVPFALEIAGIDTLGGAIQRLAADLGLENEVSFVGRIPHDRLRPLFDRADLLVVTSAHEAGPLVLLEAAIAGVPTVGTAVGHIADFRARRRSRRARSAMPRLWLTRSSCWTATSRAACASPRRPSCVRSRSTPTTPAARSCRSIARSRRRAA
jgi:hypothetical protein